MSSNDLVIETVTGPIIGDQIEWALAREHLTTNWEPVNSSKYMDVEWPDVFGVCIFSLK